VQPDDIDAAHALPDLSPTHGDGSTRRYGGANGDSAVYVCAGGRVTSADLWHVVQLANRRATGDSAVSIVLEPHLAGPNLGLDPGVAIVEARAARPDHMYFCDEQADADRIYDTLTEREWHNEPITFTFVGCTPLALTVVRARRLLGLFRDATIMTDGRAAPDRADAGTLPDVFTRWAGGYVHQFARSVLSAGDARRSGQISVVIPLFNQGRYIREAVASVRRDLPAAQIVVVNDGSTDPTTNRIFDRLRGVTKVSQRNQGLSAARNAGIRHSTGRYVVPLDADDLLPPGFLDAARRALDANPELAYVVGYARYTGLLDQVYAPAGFIPELNLFIHTHGKATGMYRKDVVQSVGGYDPRFNAFEDWELQVALHRAGYQTDVLPVEGQYYRRHAASMSFTYSNHIRHELVQQIMRKHLPMLDADDLHTGMLVLAHLWKTAYEPSRSVLLQRRMTGSGTD
jgi:glycosyltransferase involved in cell wall biosynthesis